jgi:hypothetical protein
MVYMPLPRPPLHVDVTPNVSDQLAMLTGLVAAVGTAVVVVTATLLHLWQISRTHRQNEMIEPLAEPELGP